MSRTEYNHKIIYILAIIFLTYSIVVNYFSVPTKEFNTNTIPRTDSIQNIESIMDLCLPSLVSQNDIKRLRTSYLDKIFVGLVCLVFYSIKLVVGSQEYYLEDLREYIKKRLSRHYYGSRYREDISLFC